MKFLKIQEISEVEWGNTNLTKKAYVESGKYLGFSAAGPDGRLNHFEHQKNKPTMSAIGANCGKMYFIEEKFTAIKNTIVFNPNENLVIPKYLYYFCDFYSFPKRGAGQPFIAKTDIDNTELPVPSLQEQEKIVERLDGVLEVINKSNLVNSKRKIDKFKFIKSYFAYKEENIEFEIKTLPEISINLDSKRKPIKKSLRVKGDVPYYGATGLIDYVEDFIFDEELLLISEDGANLIDRKYPIAFSINGKSWVNNHAHVMKFNDKILQKYIMYYFNFLDISKHVTGAAQPKLNQKRLNKIEIPVPKFEKDLNDIVETFKNINIKISLLNKNLAKSNILFDQLEKSILKKEFSYE